MLIIIDNEKIPEDIIAPILAKAPKKLKEEITSRWRKYYAEIKVFSNEAKKAKLETKAGVKSEIEERFMKILTKAYQEKVISKKFKTIDDKSVEDYYKSHPDEFRLPVRFRARTIMLKTEGEARKIAQKLKNGANFTELVLSDSIHPSAKKSLARSDGFKKARGIKP